MLSPNRLESSSGAEITPSRQDENSGPRIKPLSEEQKSFANQNLGLVYKIAHEYKNYGLAKQLHWKVEKVQQVMIDELSQRPLPLNAPRFEGGGMLIEQFEDTQNQNPEQNAIADNTRSQLISAVTELPEKEASVIERYHGITPESYDESMTLREIADEENLSRERIRQIKVAALGKLIRALA